MRGPQKSFPQEIARLMPILLREVSKRKKKIFSGNIALSHVVVLDYLRENGSSMMKELSEELNMTMSAGTAIIDRMVEAGLVERKRSREDRRVVEISLKSEGKTLAQQVNKERRNIAKEIFVALDQEEKEQYVRLLDKVCTSLLEEEKKGKDQKKSLS